jgi:hypothetical protein
MVGVASSPHESTRKSSEILKSAIGGNDGEF